MYKCSNCGNTSKFKEMNVVATYLDDGNKVDEKFISRDDVICCDCNVTYTEGMIEEIESTLPPLQTDIMTEISEYCSHECGHELNCSEDECILYRIEQMILKES